MNRKQCYDEAASKLGSYLNNMLSEDNGYPDKPSWGYAFSYLFACAAHNRHNFKSKSLLNLEKQNKSSTNYSWEFVVFALQQTKTKYQEALPQSLDVYKEKGTRMFNWYLLRNVNKLNVGGFTFIDRVKLYTALALYQTNEGLILDEFKTRSLQYHAFCLFVLAHIIEELPDDERVIKSFVKGVDFALKHILKDGTSLYIGRGQEQIFGYGALIYALEFYNNKIESIDPNILNSLANKVTSFQRSDGSFPLVLRHIKQEKPGVDFKKDDPYGWYGYNTLYDYLPFLGYCFAKSSNLI